VQQHRRLGGLDVVEQVHLEPDGAANSDDLATLPPVAAYPEVPEGAAERKCRRERMFSATSILSRSFSPSDSLDAPDSRDSRDAPHVRDAPHAPDAVDFRFNG
jgi:hypothetical protein